MRLMAVDDEMCTIRTVVAMLERSVELKGYRFDITAYTKPEEAMIAIVREAPDILILDLTMPGMTGMELLKFINYGPHSGFEVIILTAYPSRRQIESAASRGINCFLSKPFAVSGLISAVKAAADRLLGGGIHARV